LSNTCWTSRRDRLVCPLCEVGELLPSGRGSARCTSCASFVSGTMLEGLECIVAMPDSLGNHAFSPGSNVAQLSGLALLIVLPLVLLFLLPQRIAGRDLGQANINRTERIETR
jgi:hypothetical protein